MRSITEEGERQTGERNLTGLRESKSQDANDRQREENRSNLDKNTEQREVWRQQAGREGEKTNV